MAGPGNPILASPIDGGEQGAQQPRRSPPARASRPDPTLAAGKTRRDTSQRDREIGRDAPADPGGDRRRCARSRLPTAAITHQRNPSPGGELANAGPASGGLSVPVAADGNARARRRRFPIQEHEAKVHARAMLLERTLLDFGYQVRVVQIDTGPVITQFEIELEAGLRVSRIMSLADDLAIALAVPSVRIVAPIPGKTTVGIEVPNDHRAMVRLGDVIAGVGGRTQKCRIPLFLGKDVKGQPLVFDLAEMPHLLMAGRTGTGKSVCLNAMILSILMTKRPDEVKMILIDPKKVELSQYKRIPHLMHPVVTDMKKAESILSWACDKMEERYEFLRRAEVRNIDTYNSLGADEIYTRLQPEDDEERKRIPTYMPYIVIIIDELAEVMMTAEKGGRATHRPARPACPSRRHAPDSGHAEARGRRRHRPDQGQHAGTDRLSGDQPERFARRARRAGCRAASGQRRHALPDPRHVAHRPRPGNVR